MPHTGLMQITAAVVRAKGGPFQIEQLMLEEPRRDEVLVRIVATGMCHTDIVARDKRDAGELVYSADPTPPWSA